jgi:hypothetical protein
MNRRPAVCARLRYDYLLRIVSPRSVQEVGLPVRALNPHVQLADLLRQHVGLRRPSLSD